MVLSPEAGEPGIESQRGSKKDGSQWFLRDNGFEQLEGMEVALLNAAREIGLKSRYRFDGSNCDYSDRFIFVRWKGND